VQKLPLCASSAFKMTVKATKADRRTFVAFY
jgi:hypothetical protein